MPPPLGPTVGSEVVRSPRFRPWGATSPTSRRWRQPLVRSFRYWDSGGAPRTCASTPFRRATCCARVNSERVRSHFHSKRSGSLTSARRCTMSLMDVRAAAHCGPRREPAQTSGAARCSRTIAGAISPPRRTSSHARGRNGSSTRCSGAPALAGQSFATARNCSSHLIDRIRTSRSSADCFKPLVTSARSAWRGTHSLASCASWVSRMVWTQRARSWGDLIDALSRTRFSRGWIGHWAVPIGSR